MARIWNHLLIQIVTFAVFGIFPYFLIGAVGNSTNAALYWNLAIWMAAGLVAFYLRGLHAEKASGPTRFYFFIIQALIYVAIGSTQGSQFGDSLSWLIHKLCLYWFPLFQVVCMLGYNMGWGWGQRKGKYRAR